MTERHDRANRINRDSLSFISRVREMKVYCSEDSQLNAGSENNLDHFAHVIILNVPFISISSICIHPKNTLKYNNILTKNVTVFDFACFAVPPVRQVHYADTHTRPPPIRPENIIKIILCKLAVANHAHACSYYIQYP